MRSSDIAHFTAKQPESKAKKQLRFKGDMTGSLFDYLCNLID